MISRSREEQLASSPPGGKVQVIECSPDRMVLVISGASTGGLGCFSAIWCGFMTMFTAVWMAAGPTEIFVWLLIGLFWAVGLGMAIAAIRMKYERSYLLVDQDQVAIKKVLFGREKLKTIVVDGVAEACLAESYRSNDVPVYRVEIRASGDALKFGTSLPDEDKDWLVDTINAFFGNERAAIEEEPELDDSDDADDESNESSDGLSIAGTTASAAKRADFSINERKVHGVPEEWTPPSTPFPEDQIRILEQAPDELRFRLSLFAGRFFVPRLCVAVFIFIFCGIWFGGVIGSLLSMPPGIRIETLFLIPFLLAGLVPMIVFFGLLAGSITVKLDNDWLQVRWHAGPFGFRRRLARDEIKSVAIEAFSGVRQTNSRIRSPSVSVAPVEYKVCIARTESTFLPLTIAQDVETARHVAALVRDHLRMS